MQFNFNVETVGMPQTAEETVKELEHITNEIQKMNILTEIISSRGKLLLSLLLTQALQEVDDMASHTKTNVQEHATSTNTTTFEGVDANGQLKFSFMHENNKDDAAAQK